MCSVAGVGPRVGVLRAVVMESHTVSELVLILEIQVGHRLVLIQIREEDKQLNSVCIPVPIFTV